MIPLSQESLKRLMDLIVSMTALIVLSPLFMAISLRIKRDSAGPVFFKGERMGRHGHPFSIWKFRTMDEKAGMMAAGLTIAGDRRITPAGHFLRRTKLDELPQLINVLRGEMSLVGPRPEIRKYVELFPEDFRRILSVRPGITDLASIRFGNESEQLARFEDPEEGYVREILPEKIRLAHEYVSERSLTKDLMIIGKTLLFLIGKSYIGQH